nr:phospholipase D4 [Danio rerio]|eukprot:XP_021322934.1 phospholipase D4 [Danio rerio]
MEYYPASKYFNLHGFWPVLEDALKRAAFDRRVFVRLLVSCGRESDPSVWPFLRSLDALHSPSDNINIAVRVFIIPAGNQTRIPYTRINHSKYMVTDKLAYIGTSNWSADYFNTTAGVGLVVSQDALQKNSFQQQLRAVFQRDWSSEFSIPLSELQNNHDCAFPTHTP